MASTHSRIVIVGDSAETVWLEEGQPQCRPRVHEKGISARVAAARGRGSVHSIIADKSGNSITKFNRFQLEE